MKIPIFETEWKQIINRYPFPFTADLFSCEKVNDNNHIYYWKADFDIYVDISNWVIRWHSPTTDKIVSLMPEQYYKRYFYEEETSS